MQTPIQRKVIEQGMFVKHCKVEVYLMDLKLCENSNVTDTETMTFSRCDTIGQCSDPYSLKAYSDIKIKTM